MHSLAVVSNHSSTEVLISYPEKKSLTRGLETLFLRNGCSFSKEGLKEFLVSASREFEGLQN